MTSRRWHHRKTEQLDGFTVAVQEGRKGPDDLRVWVKSDGWQLVPMSLVFALVDFFTENERALMDINPHWRVNGDTYFLHECIAASRHGWEEPSNRIKAQRARKAS